MHVDIIGGRVDIIGGREGLHKVFWVAVGVGIFILVGYVFAYALMKSASMGNREFDDE